MMNCSLTDSGQTPTVPWSRNHRARGEPAHRWVLGCGQKVPGATLLPSCVRGQQEVGEQTRRGLTLGPWPGPSPCGTTQRGRSQDPPPAFSPRGHTP